MLSLCSWNGLKGQLYYDRVKDELPTLTFRTTGWHCLPLVTWRCLPIAFITSAESEGVGDSRYKAVGVVIGLVFPNCSLYSVENT